jgi:putative inorganic carbon (HCO3(-)) transporter
MSASPSEKWSHLMQKVLLITFHLLLVTVPFAFTWVNDELFEFNKMILTYLLTVVISGAWIVRMIAEERFIFRRTSFDIPLALFFISQLLSTIFSMHPYTSFFGYYSRFHGGLLSTITYITLFYAFVSNVPARHLPRYLLSLSFAALGAALYALPEHFGHSPSCFLITGGENFGVSCWIQDVKSRIFGTFGQPNWLAAYAITIIPVTFALTISPLLKQVRWQRWLFGVTTALLFIIVLFTRSRSGLGGLGLGMGLFGAGLLLLVLERQLSVKKILAPVGGIGLSFALALAIFGSVFTPSAFELLKSEPSVTETTQLPTDESAPVVNRLELGGTDSGEIREIVWQGAWDIFRRYPLLGSGVETFAYSYYLDRPLAHNLVSEWDFLYNKAHNEFLNFLATTGIVGLLTYLGILVWFAVVAVRILLSDRFPKNQKVVTLGLLAGILGLSISNYYGFSTVMVAILLFLYFAWVELIQQAQGKLLEENAPNSPTYPIPTTMQTGQVIGIALTGLVVLYMGWSVLTMWTADAAYTKGKQYIQAGQAATGLSFLQQAIRQSPQEALFYDELANTYAGFAVSFAQQQDATSAAQLAEAAIAASDTTLELNPRHLNFHKSKARVYITLAELNPDFLNQAKDALARALELAPTDAKLMYNLALVQIAIGDEADGLANLEKTIEMKPNYWAARNELAKKYEQQQQWDRAAEQYRYILENISPNNQEVQAQLEAVEASSSAQSQE